MPFVADPDGLDRVTFKKGPGSVHDRVLRIAYEAAPPDELPDEPLSVFSRFGVDFADGSLESVDFLLRLKREFGPFEAKPGWFVRFCSGGVWPGFWGELDQFFSDEFKGGRLGSQMMLGHFILFFEGREQG